MKRSTTLFLPLLLVLASCGTTAQYSQQRFEDGIYTIPKDEPEAVRLYTLEEIEAIASENIALKQRGKRDTLVVVLDDHLLLEPLAFRRLVRSLVLRPVLL